MIEIPHLKNIFFRNKHIVLKIYSAFNEIILTVYWDSFLFYNNLSWRKDTYSVIKFRNTFQISEYFYHFFMKLAGSETITMKHLSFLSGSLCCSPFTKSPALS